MFRMDINVGDLKRIFGIVGCSDTKANVFITRSSFCIEASSHIDRFSSASMASCSGVYSTDGGIVFDVSVKNVLEALLSSRHYEIANISYDGAKSDDGVGYIVISIGNVSHDIPITEYSDVRRSIVIGTCSFSVTQRVSGKEFAVLCKSSHDSGADSIIFSNKDSVFSIDSFGGGFVSHYKARSNTIQNIRTTFSADYLYKLSRNIRCGDDLSIMFGNDSPARINFGLSSWNVDYLIAPVICYGGY